MLDKNLSLPPTHNLLDGSQPTLIYTYRERAARENLTHVTLSEANDLLPQVIDDLYERQMPSVFVEGGPTVLNALINAGLWDEIRVFRAPMQLGQGIAAPRLGLSGLRSQTAVGVDELFWYVNE